MKAFEKWQKENGVKGRSYKADLRVWKATLEWVLTHQQYRDMGIGEKVVSTSIIEEELEEE